ncbi:hypothetical protein GYMLUDRAFT_227832 [Collybiopsis luxurians FD-317 M1]|uniref:non-specific serine/threonine protein kinase n=1 Tax=Collybiopsis luxurians FD-317 M1 TaxID=944289 RepID=A0A0D0C7W5_9AGAR|nr:hypothetical protein GYMLUDRAFT_227832 [Collybiopsis luxurians FD-317 M1]
MRILNGLCELHRCGLHHCDFAERNVLVHGDDIRLIDFDQSEYHNCDWDATIKFRPVGIEKRTPDVNRDEFGCPTLREIVCRFDMENWGSGNTVYV